MNSSKTDKPGSANGMVGYGKPPAQHRFKPGKSGNPIGRPKEAKGRRATARRVLMEKHRADPAGTGKPRQYPAIELVLILLKQLAASGDQRAFKAFTDLERRFGPVDMEGKKIGYIVLPESLTREEWEAKYSPKDPPPGDGEFIE
jgi:hypothetical protein